MYVEETSRRLMCRQLAFQNEFLGPAALSTVSEMGISTKGIRAEVMHWCDNKAEAPAVWKVSGERAAC